MSHLDEHEQDEVLDIIDAHADLFHLQGEDLSATNAVEHTIELTDDVPVRAKMYRYLPYHREEIDKQFDA